MLFRSRRQHLGHVRVGHRRVHRQREPAIHVVLGDRRRLAEAGTSFHDLVDDTRREMAQRYLQAGTATPTEIAFALGFADPSNYYRACRRWFGKPPGEVRQPAA